MLFFALVSILQQFDFPNVFGDTLALAAGIFALVKPPLIAAIDRRNWSSERKAVLTFVWCFVASLLLVWAMGQLNGVRDYSTEDKIRAVMIVFVMAIALHRWFWKPSGTSEAVDKASG